MKKFVFRLETLLQHRRNIEDRERARFVLVRRELMAALRHLESVRAMQARARSELSLVKAASCDIEEITLFYRYLNRLEGEIESAGKKVAELEQKLDAQKQIMVEASRAKKIIENLRSRKEKEFNVARDRAEQKSIDEIVAARFALKA